MGTVFHKNKLTFSDRLRSPELTRRNKRIISTDLRKVHLGKVDFPFTGVSGPGYHTTSDIKPFLPLDHKIMMGPLKNQTCGFPLNKVLVNFI